MDLFPNIVDAWAISPGRAVLSLVAPTLVFVALATFLVWLTRNSSLLSRLDGFYGPAQFALWIGVPLMAWIGALYVTHLWFVDGGFHWWRIDTWLSGGEGKEKSAAELRLEEIRNLLGVVAIVVGSLVGAITLGNSLRRTALQEAEKTTNRDRLNAEVFAKAVEQLGAGDRSTRLGAIYSLESLARTDEVRGGHRLTRQIMETLAAFAREQSLGADSTKFLGERARLTDAEAGAEPEYWVAKDVAAAVAVLSRSYPAHLRPHLSLERGVDLRAARLAGLSLPDGADLRCFNFSGADLRRVQLRKANLRGVWMSGANLNKAQWVGADISSAHFTSTGWGDAYGLQAILKDAAWEKNSEPGLPQAIAADLDRAAASAVTPKSPLLSMFGPRADPPANAEMM